MNRAAFVTAAEQLAPWVESLQFQTASSLEQCEDLLCEVNDEEARALLLSIDPLAALAQTQEQIHRRLLELTPAPSEELEAAWRAVAEASLAAAAAPEPPALDRLPARFLILITCRDEKQQVELLQRFAAEGRDFKALLS
jgi:hypothetical protein